MLISSPCMSIPDPANRKKKLARQLDLPRAEKGRLKAGAPRPNTRSKARTVDGAVAELVRTATKPPR